LAYPTLILTAYGVETNGLPHNGELSLTQALNVMRARDPTIAIGQTAVAQADADTITAGERPNATLGYSTSKINPAGHNGSGSLWDKSFDTTLSISQTFERGGKRKYRQDQATHSLDAAHADYADTLRGERLSVSQAYWELKRAQEKQENVRALDAIARSSFGAADTRLKHGDVAPLDVERLHIGAAEADNAVDQATAAVSDAQITLASFLDVTEQASTLRAIDEWPQQGTPNPDLESTLGRRPDIAAALQRVRAAEAALGLAHAQRKRDVTVSGQYEHNPTPFGHTLLGIGVSIPLFTGNQYEGEIRRAYANLDAAQAQLARVQVAAGAEVRRAVADVHAADARVQRYDGDLVERARRAEHVAETAYARSGISLAELLDARRDLRAVENDATDARADFAEALAALAAAAPTGATPQP
jgi:cobalt-zinc-cadmium efflux system outer membrane protein